MDSEVTPDLIQEIASAVSSWRMQEYILLSFYTLYVYYCLTTLEEEITTVHSQTWGLGRILFVVLRYAAALQISINMAAIYRTYFHITPEICKGLYITSDTSYAVAVLTADVTLGLCLSALLGAKLVYLAIVLFLCAAHPLVTWIFNIVGSIQIPAQDLDILDQELGYPCHPVASEDFFGTVAGKGANIRAYINCARTGLLMLLAIAVFIFRYRKTSGRIMQVLRRDGGLYYLIATATRVAAAFVYTPAILSSGNFESNPIAILIMGAHEVIVPIFAQRLLINMRNVDYMGSRPFASTLMFAQAPGSSRDLSEDGDNDEVKEEP